MIAVNFYTFAKRKNSTKRPTGTATTYNCVLKEGCSIIAPVIGLDIGLTANPHQYNYAQISAFGRYYYVSDWAWEDRLWWATLEVDVLATYNTPIINSTEYITRAGTNYDGDIIDMMYPAIARKQFDRFYLDGSSAAADAMWVNNIDDGFYVVGIINNDDQSVGAVSYYIMLAGQFMDLKNALLTDTDWTDISVTNPDLGDNLYRSIFNPYQYITTINWFPFTITLPQARFPLVTTINVGWWTLNVSAYRMETNGYCIRLVRSNGYGHRFTIRNHPQAFDRGGYLNANPYSNFRMLFPPFGEIPLDGALLAGAYWDATGSDTWPQFTLEIDVDIYVDLVSGIGTLGIYFPTRESQGNVDIEISYHTAQVSVPIQMAQISSGDAGAYLAHSAMNKVNDWIAQLGINELLGIGKSAAAVGDGVIGSQAQLSTVGTNGNMSVYLVVPSIIAEYAIMVEDAINDKGRPVCKYDRIGDYTGFYVQTSGAHIDIAGYESEIEQINVALDGGVYLE